MLRSPVCVLGVSRSGTSLTVRMLNVLGVYLGSEGELMAPAPGNNPTGFWEHEAIANLNEEILKALGSSPRERWMAWEDPPPLPLGWENSPQLDRLREEAWEILGRSFAGQRLWGWKDPRNCLTLPFWQRLVPRMRYVVCVRHPLDVAGSLRARDGLSQERSLWLWLLYTSRAVLHTNGHPRLFVSYEDYFPSWEGQARRLAGFIGVPPPVADQRAAISGHHDEGLWHHRDATEGGGARGADAPLPPAIAELYPLLRALCRAEGPGADAEAVLARKAAELAAPA